MKVLYVYIAGPYTKGVIATNIRNAIHAADMVRELGHVPFVPHLTHLWDIVSPRSYESWLDYDFHWLKKCDRLIRLDGESPGADREVVFAHENGIPVYAGLQAFLNASVQQEAKGGVR